MIRRCLPVAALLCCVGVPKVLAAQSVTLRGGTTIARVVAPSTKISVPVVIDLSAGAGTNVSALTMGVNWNAARLTFDSVKSAGFGSLTTNAVNAGTGSLSLSVFDAAGTNSTVTMATVYFTSAAGTGGTRVAFNPTVAGTDLGASILPLFRLQQLEVCVATSGLWGDANGDLSVNIIDAQQIARFTVGLSVANGTALGTQGDVTADGNVNIIDAQQIARFTVALSAAARVNTTFTTAPPVNALTMSQSSAAVAIGGSTQFLANPTDASSNAINGCQPVVFTSSAPSIASVDSTGRVVGLANGTATITATSNAKTATATIIVGTVVGPAATVAVVAGDQQYAYTGTFAPVPMQVIVRDASSVPVPNVPVTFTVSVGTFNSGTPFVVNTDVNGLASAAAWTPSGTGATATMTAAVAGLSSATMTANLVGSTNATTTCIYDGWSSRCMGNGLKGQLGNGASLSSTTPVNVSVGATTMKVATRTGWGDHFCALDNGGVAYCWGWNVAGQLGDGTRTDRNVPTLVTGGLAFQSISAGSAHTCAVTTAGSVYCWGVNVFGQLGDSTIGTSRTAPVRAKTPAGVVFTKVAVGSNHTCATTAAGDVYCWGLNSSGQLGDGTIGAPRTMPASIAGALKFPKIASSPGGTCGLTSAGAAYCWGQNNNGQLGNGTVANSGTPVAVQGGLVFSDITAGFQRACGETGAIGNEYTLWCWGLGGQGLGDGTSINRPAPTLVGISLTQLFHGGLGAPGYACGMETGANALFCWGGNPSGQLGFGNTTTTAGPDIVARPTATAGAAAASAPRPDNVQSQSVAAGTALPIVPQLIVADAVPNALAGITVTWTVLSGGGTVTNTTSVTNAEGMATSGGWTLGPVIGIQKLQATVSGILLNGSAAPPLRQTFIAYGTNAPASAVKISGDSIWTAAAGTQATNPLVPQVLKVLDGANNPIPNVAVTFTLGANSGSLGASSSAIVLTDANGLATLPANEWLPNNTAGVISTLTATVNGIATPITFSAFKANSNFGLVSCELTNAGAAMCAGLNTYGTVGDNSTTNRTTFVPVSGGLTFTSLAEGVAMHKCGIVGTAAYCWGHNSMGELGDGTLVDRSVPTLVSGGLAFSKLYTQGNTTCGLTTGSVLYCWGWSGTGGFGVGEAFRSRNFNVPTLVGTGGLTFTKIAVMDDGVCGLTTTGAIACRARASIGTNGDGTVDQRVTFSTWNGGPWSDVSSGNNSICALDAAGLAWCLGSDQSGTLGIGGGGTTTIRTTPMQTLGGITFASIHVQNFRVCARRANGELYCWGGNNGTGTTALVDRPTIVPGFIVTSMRQTTFRNGCAKVANGQLYCWGINIGVGSGTVGDGTTVDRLSPSAVINWPDGPAAATAVSMIASNAGLTAPANLVVSPNPSVTVRDRFGAPVAGVTVTFSAASGNGTVTGGTVVTNASGVAAVGSWTLPAALGLARLDVTSPGLPPVAFPVTVIAAPASLTIGGGGNIYLPDFGASAPIISATVLDASNAPIVGISVTFSITAGNGNLSGASPNAVSVTTTTFGVASMNSGTWTAIPTAAGVPYTIQASVAGLAPVTITLRRLSNGAQSANNPHQAVCRLTTAGAARCWGGNNFGAIGDGTNTTRSAPTAVSGGLTFQSLADGPLGFHKCGLTTSGAAYCWGLNEAGQLGNNSFVSSNVPVPVSGGLTFSSLAVGPWSTCGITTGGALYCWGWGSFSFRGDGEIYGQRSVPTAVNTAGNTFVSVSVGGVAICALTASGQAYCWGEAGTGALGTGSTSNVTTPVSTNTALRFTQIALSYSTACGVTTTGTVACWGSNANGGVGIGTTTNQPTPVELAGISGALQVRVAGFGSACARTSASIYCWGSNLSGEIGDGTTTSPRTSPVQVGAGLIPTGLFGNGNTVACASTSTQLYCWGSANGGIGDGANTQRLLPTAVQWSDAVASNPAQTYIVGPASFSAAAGGANIVTVTVKNSVGTAVANVPVNFVVTSGGGSVTFANVSTDGAGIASTSWMLAGAVGTVGKLEARVVGLPTVVMTGTVAATP